MSRLAIACICCEKPLQGGTDTFDGVNSPTDFMNRMGYMDWREVAQILGLRYKVKAA